MQLPLQITFHGLAHSDAIEAYVRKRAQKLETFYDRLISCRVVVEAPHRHKHEGRPYHVRIDLGIPGHEIVISRDVSGDSREDAYAAIDEAFDQAGRSLQDRVKVRRGRVKRHERALHGHVKRLSTYEGWGFIEAEDGEEIYFHRNAVLHDGFDRMRRGDRVRYSTIIEEDGIHASTVVLLR